MKQKYWARASYGTNRHNTAQAIIFTLFNNICTQANLQISLLSVQNGEWYGSHSEIDHLVEQQGMLRGDDLIQKLWCGALPIFKKEGAEML